MGEGYSPSSPSTSTSWIVLDSTRSRWRYPAASLFCIGKNRGNSRRHVGWCASALHLLGCHRLADCRELECGVDGRLRGEGPPWEAAVVEVQQLAIHPLTDLNHAKHHDEDLHSKRRRCSVHDRGHTLPPPVPTQDALKGAAPMVSLIPIDNWQQQQNIPQDHQRWRSQTREWKHIPISSSHRWVVDLSRCFKDCPDTIVERDSVISSEVYSAASSRWPSTSASQPSRRGGMRRSKGHHSRTLSSRQCAPIVPSKNQWNGPKIGSNSNFWNIFKVFVIKLFLIIQRKIFLEFIFHIRV